MNPLTADEMADVAREVTGRQHYWIDVFGAGILDGMDSFDFDIHGRAPDGSSVILHFEATLQKTGKA